VRGLGVLTPLAAFGATGVQPGSASQMSSWRLESTKWRMPGQLLQPGQQPPAPGALGGTDHPDGLLRFRASVRAFPDARLPPETGDDLFLRLCQG
jgi:hypothetical protein